MTEPIYVIGYSRISDPAQLRGDGLNNQIKSIEKFILDNKWTLFPNGKVEQEVYTGRKVAISHRPKYNELIELIKRNPNKVKYFVIPRIDRSSRRGSQEYLEIKAQLASLGVQLRDAQNLIQPTINTLEHRGVSFDWSNKSTSHLAEVLMAEVAKEEVSNILTRTIDTSIGRVESGFKLRESNYGYKNAVVLHDGKEKTIQVANEKESPYIIAIFEKTIEDVFSDQEIADYINSLGYKSRPRKIRNGTGAERKIVGETQGNKLTRKQLQKYRQNPIYCGVNIENWGHTKTRKIVSKTFYKGLVSIETFNKANKGKVYIEELPDNKVQIYYEFAPEKIIKRRQKFRKDFIFKNVILCDICKKELTASPSRSKNKNQYSYYHCTRKHERFSKTKEEVDTAMMNFLSKIKFSDKYHSILKKVLLHKYESEQVKSLDTQVILNTRITSLQTELRQTLDAIKKSSSEAVSKELEIDFEKLGAELKDAQTERQKIELGYDELTSFLDYSKTLMEHPIEMFLNVETYSEQMAIYSLLFSEFPTYSEITNGTPKTSLFFKVNADSDSDKSLDVTLRGIEPRLPP